MATQRGEKDVLDSCKICKMWFLNEAWKAR